MCVHCACQLQGFHLRLYTNKRSDVILSFFFFSVKICICIALVSCSSVHDSDSWSVFGVFVPLEACDWIKSTSLSCMSLMDPNR